MALHFPSGGTDRRRPLQNRLKYFLYQDDQDIRIGLGTERVVEQARRKGFIVRPERFDTRKEAEAVQRVCRRNSRNMELT
jgi:hypothetical protein